MAETDSRRSLYYQSGHRAGLSHYYPLPQPSEAYLQLVIPPLQKGTIDDVKISLANPGYEDTKTGELVVGLEKHILTSWENIPTYIFGQHSFAHFALAEAIKAGDIEPHAIFINIDTHPDHSATTEHLPLSQTENLRRVAEYTNDLDIDAFIEAANYHEYISGNVWVHPLSRPAEDTDLLGAQFPCVQAGNNSEALNRILSGEIPKEELVVSVDLDYFVFWTQQHIQKYNLSYDPRHPDMSPDDIMNQEIAKIREIMKHAGLIILATSPGFIDQEEAIAIAHKLLTLLS